MRRHLYVSLSRYGGPGVVSAIQRDSEGGLRCRAVRKAYLKQELTRVVQHHVQNIPAQVEVRVYIFTC